MSLPLWQGAPSPAYEPSSPSYETMALIAFSHESEELQKRKEREGRESRKLTKLRDYHQILINSLKYERSQLDQETAAAAALNIFLPEEPPMAADDLEPAYTVSSEDIQLEMDNNSLECELKRVRKCRSSLSELLPKVQPETSKLSGPQRHRRRRTQQATSAKSMLGLATLGLTVSDDTADAIPQELLDIMGKRAIDRLAVLAKTHGDDMGVDLLVELGATSVRPKSKRVRKSAK